MVMLHTEGLDELIDDMYSLEADISELMDEMLFVGADEVKKAWQKAIRGHRHIDTGNMLESIGYKKKIGQEGDIKKIDIYPQGKDRKGVRNAEKAYVLHYGRGKKVGSRFVDDAEDMAGPMAEKRLYEIYDQFLKNNNL